MILTSASQFGSRSLHNPFYIKQALYGQKSEEVLYKDFTKGSVITVTFEQETWFMVTSKYEPNWAKREKICTRQVILDRSIDRLITLRQNPV